MDTLPRTLPFENRVLLWINRHPDRATILECARELGLSRFAATVAFVSLEEKGLIEYQVERHGEPA